MARKITSKTDYNFNQLVNMKKTTKSGKTTYGDFRKVINRMGSKRIIETFGGENLNKLNKEQMRIIFNRLNTNANQQIKKLNEFKQKKGYTFNSPAVNMINRSGINNFKMPSINATRNQVYKELKNVLNFLNAKTSTVQGWKKQMKSFEELTNMSAEEQTEYWNNVNLINDLYNEWMLTDSNARNYGSQDVIDTYTYSSVDSKSPLSIITDIVKNNPNSSLEKLRELINKNENLRKLYNGTKEQENDIDENYGETFIKY